MNGTLRKWTDEDVAKLMADVSDFMTFYVGYMIHTGIDLSFLEKVHSALKLSDENAAKLDMTSGMYLLQGCTIFLSQLEKGSKKAKEHEEVKKLIEDIENFINKKAN